MAELNIRADAVDVEQIMQQIRSRIREKRGVDYTEEQIREMASVKLQTFLDPRGVRSDLLARFQHQRTAEPLPSYAFEEPTLYESHRAIIRWIRRLLRPLLKLFFNPNKITQALHIQARLNANRQELDSLYYEVLHNLVLEMTRLSIDVRNLKMRVESLSGRLDFNERRARALESVVQYRATPDAERPAADAGPAETGDAGARTDVAPGTAEGPGQRSRRRRRRRGRRGGSAGHQAPEAAAGPASEGDVASTPSTEHQEPAEAGAADRGPGAPDTAGASDSMSPEAGDPES